jgi:transcriptional regulator with XRE-family HTH domain
MTEHTGKNLRRVMANLNLTIEQVVERSGLDLRTVKAILDGSHRPHARTLKRLAEGLGVSCDEFFLDPTQLLYRRFDRQTNPIVEEVIAASPDLFAGWTDADFDELHSRFGTGGPLTADGTLAVVRQMNRNRQLYEKLAVLLESSHADLISGIVEMMYEKVMAEENP